MRRTVNIVVCDREAALAYVAHRIARYKLGGGIIVEHKGESLARQHHRHRYVHLAYARVIARIAIVLAIVHHQSVAGKIEPVAALAATVPRAGAPYGERNLREAVCHGPCAEIGKSVQRSLYGKHAVRAECGLHTRRGSKAALIDPGEVAVERKHRLFGSYRLAGRHIVDSKYRRGHGAYRGTPAIGRHRADALPSLRHHRHKHSQHCEYVQKEFHK